MLGKLKVKGLGKTCVAEYLLLCRLAMTNQVRRNARFALGVHVVAYLGF